MGRLLLFGRQFDLASDDLLLPMGLQSIMHLVGCVVYTSIFLFSVLNQALDPCFELHVYLISSIAATFVLLLIEANVARISLLGSIADETPRKHISNYIYLQLVATICEISTQIYGITILFGPLHTNCDVSGFIFLKIVVIIHLLVLLVFVCVVSLLLIGSTRGSLDQFENRSLWEKRFQFLCLGHRKKNPSDRGETDALSAVAKVFSDFFFDHNLAPSDVFVGILLLRRKQHKVIQRNLEPDTSSPVRYCDLQEIIHYYDYAESIYGFPLFMYTNFKEGLKLLCCSCSNKPPTSNPLPRSPLDSVKTHFTFPGMCCFIPRNHQIAVDERILHFSRQNDLFHPPFFVCVDENRKTIVIAIRGTLSAADILVDLNCDITEFEIPNIKDGYGTITAYTHSGILRAAINIESELRQFEVLKLINQNEIYQNHSIIVVGHSLGGGVASLLCHRLRINGYPTTRSFAYSPPGCIVSQNAIPYFKTFCTSIVIGNDVVPRLNLKTVKRFNEQVHAILRNCKHPKARVLAGAIGRLFTPKIEWMFLYLPAFCIPSWLKKVSEEEYFDHLEAEDQWQYNLERLQSFSENGGHVRDSGDMSEFVSGLMSPLGSDEVLFSGINHMDMFIPGKVVHWRRERIGLDLESVVVDTQLETDAILQIPSSTKKKKLKYPHHQYKPVLLTSDDAFSELLVAGTMILDHFPNYNADIFDEIKQNPQFLTSSDSICQGVSI